MHSWVFEQMASERLAELRREAAAFRRVPGRGDRVREHRRRGPGWLRVDGLHRHASVVGCQP